MGLLAYFLREIPSPHHVRMKHFVNFFAAAALLSATAFADTVATPPVGYTTITIPANGVKAVSIPLDQIPDYQGTVSGVTSTTITTSSAAWSTTQFGPFASNPHVVRMLSGTSVGRHFKVSSNTSTTLTVTLPAGITDISTVIATGDKYELVPVDTLGSFFGTGSSTSVYANTNASLADNVWIRTSLGWLTYYHNGTNWMRMGGDGTSQDSVAMMPENGVLFVRQASTSLSVVISGQVPVTNLVTDIGGASVSFLANRFPTDTTLSGLGLQNLTNWVKSSNPSAADNVWLRTNLGWLTYYYDGTNWLRAGGDGTAQNPTISSGSAVLIVHQGSLPLSLNQALPYTL